MLRTDHPERPHRALRAGLSSAKAEAIAPAATLTGDGGVAVRQVPVPEPAPCQVRVRLEGCGVCASNLPMWEGRAWFDYPRAPGEPGHEGWGRVDAVGASVQDLQPGDRVTFLSYHAFAAYDIADAAAVVKLPDALADHPFPGEPLGCAMNVFSRSGIAEGQTVAIVGVGFLGILLARLARNAGARVFAISRRSFSLQMAKRFSAPETIALADHERVVQRVREATAGRLCDCVIEATGKQEPLDLAAQLVRERGRLVVAGYHQDGLRQVDMQLWNWRGIDVINAHERDDRAYVEGMRRAVTAVTAGHLDPRPLYTHRFRLEDLAEALRLMQERPDGFVKGLIINDT